MPSPWTRTTGQDSSSSEQRLRQDQQAGLHRAGLHHGRLLHRASDPSAKKESWKKESATTGDSATTGESAAGDSATTGESAKKESWKKESATTGESATTTEESTATTEESATTEAPAKKESWKKDKPWGGVHTGGGALAKVVAEDWGQDSGSSSESGSSWKKEKPAGGVHAGGGGLADSGGGLAAGSLLLLGGIGFGAYTLRRRNATSGAGGLIARAEPVAVHFPPRPPSFPDGGRGGWFLWQTPARFRRLLATHRRRVHERHAPMAALQSSRPEPARLRIPFLRPLRCCGPSLWRSGWASSSSYNSSGILRWDSVPPGPSRWLAAPPTYGPVPPPVAELVLPRSAPKRLSIPQIAVDAPFTTAGHRRSPGGSTHPPPDDSNLVGWFAGGVTPGERGAAIVAGHVDTKTGPAVFLQLQPAQARGQGRHHPRGRHGRHVQGRLRRNASARRASPMSGSTPTPRTRSCVSSPAEASYDRKAKDYTDNVVVFAHLDSA